MYEGQDVGGSRRPNPRMYIYADPVPQTDITVSATLSQIGDVIDASGTPPGKHSYTFKAGQAAPQVVEFRIDNDLDDEPTSFVTLEVHAGQGYTLSPTKSSATTRVTDKDGGPTVSLTAASASVTEGGNATFTLTRGTEGAEPRWEDTGISRVRLRISQRGDFVADEDLGEKTITLTKGQTSATYDVPTIGDGKGEKDGTITVELLPNRTNVNQLSGYAIDFPPNNQAVSPSWTTTAVRRACSSTTRTPRSARRISARPAATRWNSPPTRCRRRPSPSTCPPRIRIRSPSRPREAPPVQAPPSISRRAPAAPGIPRR